MNTLCNICKKTETDLRCQKCNNLICYKCITETPVGYRCANCVTYNKPPMYKIPLFTTITSSILAMIIGIIIGLISSTFIPVTTYFSFISLIVSAFFGIIFSQMIFQILNWTSNGKRGKKMQIISINAIIIASFIRLYPLNNLATAVNDLNGLVLLIIGTLILWEKFK